jgi:hypothetical protein
MRDARTTRLLHTAIHLNCHQFVVTGQRIVVRSQASFFKLPHHSTKTTLSQHYSLKRQVDDRFITVETIQNHDLQDRANYRGRQLRASMLQGSASPLLDQRTSSLEVTNNTLKLLRSQGVLAFFFFKRHNEDMLDDPFWNQVQRTNDCWWWMGSKMSHGYGGFWDGTKQHYTHRYSWEFFNGPIPANRVIMHTCDNRACVNPQHLRCGTQEDNVHDMIDKQRAFLPGGDKSYSKLDKKHETE